MNLAALTRIDRRAVFVVVALTMTIPFFTPLAFRVRVSPPVRKAYDFIEALPEGSRVLVSFDYGPSQVAEIEPGAVALLRHLFRRRMKVVAIALWPDAAPFAPRTFRRLSEEFRLREGEDWVFLGYKYGGPTGSGVIEPMGTRFQDVWPYATFYLDGGRTVASREVPLLRDVGSYRDFRLLVTFSAGVPGIKEYLQMANSRYRVPIIGSVSAVTAPELFPFLDSGQLAGLSVGVIGGAEYERLLGREGLAHRILPVQSITQLAVILLIVLGNAIDFLVKRKAKT